MLAAMGATDVWRPPFPDRAVLFFFSESGRSGG